MADQVTRTTPDNLSGQPVRHNPDRSDNPDKGIYTLSGCPGRMSAKQSEAAQDPNQPFPCWKCDGRGRIIAYRMDDRRYPVICRACSGTGIA